MEQTTTTIANAKSSKRKALAKPKAAQSVKTSFARKTHQSGT